jgi:Predicted membrane protein (DUF2142)
MRCETILRPVNCSANQTDAGRRVLIFLLCGLAAARVFVFSAAFPFFSVVDEQVHVDLAVKYANGKIPRGQEPAAAEAAPFLSVYASPEFLSAGEKIPPPPWKQPAESVRDRLAAKQAFYLNQFQNHESSEPPFYYALAGGWWRLGKFFKFDGLTLLYWLRFLNVIFIAALVWLAAVTARKIFPENRFVQIAVPALAAFFPQSVFYSVNNDVLAPLAFGAAFLLLLDFFRAEIPSPRLAAVTGLALAAAFLTKISNLPLVAIAGLFLAAKFFQLLREGKLKTAALAFATSAACAGLPAAAWLAWCKINFGDFTGTAQKIKFLNWTDVPFAQWLHHPVFTGEGFWYFLKNNLASFWFGEQMWHRAPMTNPAAESVVLLLTLCLLALVLAALLRRRTPFTTPQRTALWFGLACLAASLAFFAWLSVKYDFQDCFYPSRAHPFFVSGRLMLGLLVPFLILFACGLDRLTANFSARAKFLLLAALLVFLQISELTADWPVFASEYNWFHF